MVSGSDIDTKRLQKLVVDSKEEQKILSLNAWHLGRYIIEHSKKDGDSNSNGKIDIPGGFAMGEYMVNAEKYPILDDANKAAFINQYVELEKAAGDVTARTLYATRIHGKGFLSAIGTSAGKHLLVLAVVSAAFMCMMIKFPQSSMFSFYAAGLGACVFVLRVTQEKFKLREFDPAWIPSHYIRILLGSLAGGTIVFFPELLNLISGSPNEVSDVLEGIHQKALEAAVNPDQQTALEAARQAVQEASLKLDEKSDIGVGTGLVAFVFGYAVDIYYGLLDRIGAKVNG